MSGSGLKQKHEKRRKEKGRWIGLEEHEVEAGVLVTTASETAIPPDDDGDVQNQKKITMEEYEEDEVWKRGKRLG